jgi:hypothetical protein
MPPEQPVRRRRYKLTDRLLLCWLFEGFEAPVSLRIEFSPSGRAHVEIGALDRDENWTIKTEGMKPARV